MKWEYRIRDSDDGKKVRQVLRNRFRFSRRMFRRLKLEKGIRLNGDPVYLDSLVQAGDYISILIPEDQGEGVKAEPIPIQVVDEDGDIILLEKQPGIVVHPTKGHTHGTLANGLAHYWMEQGEFRLIRPVTRLDKDTTGLILFAKHAHAHAYLSVQMERKRYEREYLALVQGEMKSSEGKIDAPIARCDHHPNKREVSIKGAHAVTHYHVEERYLNATLLRLRLETGRTHQIRVHLSYLGHPIMGDGLYGGDSSYISRQALHATTLRLVHPRDGSPRMWHSPLPSDMMKLIQQLK